MRMRRFKWIILLIIACLSFQLAKAQQEAMYTHYMYNTLAVNPAYAGSRDALTMTALCRIQWVGFEGAPKTQTFTIHSPVYKDAVNLGLSFVNDKIGPMNNTAIALDYAFRVKLSSRSKIALGLKFGINTYNFDLTSMDALNANDTQANMSERTWTPNLGFGLYYAMDKFYLGFSVPKLVENNYHYARSVLANDYSIEKKHFYTIAGWMLPLTTNLNLKPTTLLKITQGAPIEADFSMEFLFYEKFALGAMYRTGDAMGLLLSYAITEHLCAGYSFDWSFVNKTAKYNDGSHELILQYDFSPKSKRRYTSLKSFCKF